MATVHFLNVKNGDCSIIQHNSGRVTMIDVCNASPTEELKEQIIKAAADLQKGVNGDFRQKLFPVNPVSYLKQREIASIFRFIITHPDMDHMDGIKSVFDAFSPLNFWDHDNNKEMNFEDGSPYDEDDWNFYTLLRDGKPEHDPKRLTLFSGTAGQYYNQAEGGGQGGDGLTILAPTSGLVTQACEDKEFNDCSYVLLYRTGNNKIIFAGDSEDATWEHILANHGDAVRDVDVLIAPHHGRDSGRDWEFLDVLKPALTLFGNASSEHLAYQAWWNRGLPIITNNQANCIVLNPSVSPIDVYVTCEQFARLANPYTQYSAFYDAYYWGSAARKKAVGK
ncbi:hydrolase (metallo-beta-lactamase superfamily) [Candidatus Koribacter versatilis Ellin345]|uniref:Hydrolase (Metallo-beta-lactamase superfamily) n=1 Tax=Koribacter versatilis (strain Ellin345) TaxID=204669 RepID=Q1ISK8_KORVE|nr:hypothetical protein [Candidatus Koribacter versatilis]ABF40142.1 hydrolase (metallo-beta-lactamase superfamily) [Candidatus Koribacter versatilis Ellin345]